MGDKMIGSLGLNLRMLRFKLNKQQSKNAKEIGISTD
ncbi:DNA-binding XRE family transcriptional regulator [Cytobacillus horneckiae]